MTEKEARKWLSEPDHAIVISGWCVKSIAELENPADNKCMEVLGRGATTRTRCNSVLKELREYPDECKKVDFNEERDTCSTDNPLCPYCGYEDQDAFELSSDSGDTTCGHCNQEYDYEREISVSYTTFKKETK